jgi:pantoate--beta-alanine ligase
MERIQDPAEFRESCRQWRESGLRLALVPTMGYLHEGHLSLMDEAARRADISVASIFVNPVQFGPGEDLDRYPRSLERDCELAEQHGVDLIFTPQPGAMYHPDHAAWIDVPDLSRTLCGASRPGHFRGVCTVVAKLLHLARPHVAVFGQKDWQQLAILRRMVRDLDFDVEIAGMPIVREEDGLALSSRNVNLDQDERQRAPQIYAGLRMVREMALGGERDARALLGALAEHIAAKLPDAEADYLELVDPESMERVDRIMGPTLLAVAVKMRNARLIDNLLLEV